MSDALVRPAFHPTGMGNELLDCGAFYVSFNGGQGGNPLMALGIFAQDAGSGGETALCHRTVNHRSRGLMYILNGDWRADYLRLAPEGWDACLKFYESKRATHRSSWSEDEP